MGASAKIVLFKGKKYKDNKHPVYLQITINRKNKYYTVGENLKCIPDQWNPTDHEFSKKFPNYKQANRNLQKAIYNANKELINLEEANPNFTHEDFKVKYNPKNDILYLFEYMDKIKERLNNAGKIGSAVAYQTARSVLFKYFGKEMELTKINSKDLSLFVEHCQSKGLKPNSISRYLKALRAVYNRAINEENIDYYPFKKFDWKPLSNKTVKRAISKTDMKRIMDFEAEQGTDLFNAKHYFSFMYLTFGLNFADMAKIERGSITKVNEINILKYERSKGGKLYQIPLNNEALKILDYYRDKSTSSIYVFPILDENIHVTPLQIRQQIKAALANYNKNLKRIGEHLEIAQKITSYVSRHTFASVLVKAGTSVFTISEMMGHSDLKTTQIYLKELDYSEKIEASKNLLN
jgi:site-specific recombinase XerD